MGSYGDGSCFETVVLNAFLTGLIWQLFLVNLELPVHLSLLKRKKTLALVFGFVMAYPLLPPCLTPLFSEEIIIQ